MEGEIIQTQNRHSSYESAWGATVFPLKTLNTDKPSVKPRPHHEVENMSDDILVPTLIRKEKLIPA